MPIVVKDFTWSETETEVAVVVPLKGVRPAKADVYSTATYIKVNYPPYLFEADLLHPVDDVESKAEIGDGKVKFVLKKAEAVIWGELVLKDVDKATLRARREQSQEASFKRQVDDKKAATEAATKRQSAAVRKQMDLDAGQRKALQNAKDLEKGKFSEAMDEVAAADAEREAKLQAAAAAKRKGARKAKQKAGDTAAAATAAAKHGGGGGGAAAAGPAKKPEGPTALRKTGTISIKFTPRAFVTAARESHAVEESEWLEKQAAARKAVQEAKDAVDSGIADDPLWLKDKGNEFFKAGNYQSAVNAFTAAVTLDPKMAPLYSNRAAAHMKMNDFHAGAQDCSKAISLLTPPVDANRRSRLIAYSRRAAALSALEDYESAINDIQIAISLDPENTSLAADLATLRDKASKSTSGTTSFATVRDTDNDEGVSEGLGVVGGGAGGSNAGGGESGEID